MSDIHRQAHLVDLKDDELKEFLGGTYHRLKNIEEEKKNDPEIQQMQERLNEYKRDNYDDAIKELKARLKAARALAKARGIKWNPPEIS